MKAAATSKNRDRIIALALTSIGAIGLILTLRVQPHALDLNPGVEGCLTTGIVGMLLALLEGVPYTRVILLSLPVALLQWITCRIVGAPALAVLALEAIVAGFFGVVLAPICSRESRELRESREHTPASAVERTEPRANPHAAPTPARS